MRFLIRAFVLVSLASVLAAGGAQAALLNFNDLITGATSYSFDGDGDSFDDVIFSTTDPLGFNTVGPGLNQTYINEPGLEGSTLLNPDLRVDFLVGAVNNLTFGFALDDSPPPVTLNSWADFKVYDAGGSLLASSFVQADYTVIGSGLSSFPEGLISVNFAGLASYALFDFNNDPTGGQRFIIDNFQGTFGTSEVPEPATMVLLGLGLAGLAARRRRNS